MHGSGFRFGPYTLDLGQRTLFRDGTQVPLRAKPWEVLAYLIRHRERTVSRDDLLAAVWPGVTVSDAALASTLRDLRRALGDDARAPRFVETTRGRGFRFVHQAEEISLLPEDPAEAMREGCYVGRSEVLGDAERILLRARAGHGQALFLLGDAGVGKTRTALELVRRCEGWGVRAHVGRCLEEEGAPAYWAWTQLLRSCLRDLAENGPDEDGLHARVGTLLDDAKRLLPEADDAAPVSDLHEDGATARFRLFDAVTQVFRAAADAQPRLLLLDDLHRADAASVWLLRHMLQELDDMPLLVVATWRDAEVDDAHPITAALAETSGRVQRAKLAGLDVDAVRALATDVAREPVGSELASALHARTAGNPLFVAEMTRALCAETRLDDAGAAARVTGLAPEGVRQVILARLARVPEPGRRALAAAAVIGREFGRDLLARVCSDLDGADLDAALDAGLRGRLLEGEPARPGQLRFAHILIRDALYESLAPSQRTALHRAVGRSLEKVGAPELEARLASLAHHFLQAAGEGEAARACEYARRAGEKALAQAAYEEAAARFDAALGALELRRGAEARGGSSPVHDALAERERAELLVLLGRARWRSGATTAAREAFAEAARLAREVGAAEVLAHAALGYAGRTDATPGVDPTATALMEEARDALPRADSALRSELLARLGTEYYFEPDPAPSQSLTREAVEMAERLGDPEALAYALSAHHYSLLRPEVHPRERLPLCERLAELAAATGAEDVLALGLQEEILDRLELADLAGFDRALRQFAELADRLRQPFFRWMASAYGVTRTLVSGRIDEADRLAHETFALGTSIGSPNAVAMFGGQLFFVRREQGRLAELEPVFRGLVEDQLAVPGFVAALAGIYSAEGRHSEARDLFERLAPHDFAVFPRDHGWAGIVATLVPVCAGLGDEAGARTLRRLLEPFEGRLLPVGHGSVWQGAGVHQLAILDVVCGDFDRAEERFGKAVDLYRRIGARLYLAHARREWAEMLRARGRLGDREHAGTLLGEAITAYTDLGLDHHARAAQGVL